MVGYYEVLLFYYSKVVGSRCDKQKSHSHLGTILSRRWFVDTDFDTKIWMVNNQPIINNTQ